jgi:hypothetical protein
VIQGRRAQFGEPLLLDLDGLGIRDMARQGADYTLIAGPVDGKGKFRIFTWRGPGTTPTELRTSHLGKFNPEALVLYPETGISAMHILSDDGNQSTGGQRCKDIKDPAKRTFRSFWLMNPS